MSARPPLRVVDPAPADPPASSARVIRIAPAPGPEGKLLRALQDAISAYNRGVLPTPRERESIRRGLHGAVDVYLTDKLAEAGADAATAQRRKEENADGNDGNDGNEG